VETRGEPKFQGADDQAHFNRNDLYDVLPILEAVMDALGREDAQALHLLEDIMNQELPRFVRARGEVFGFLTGCMREVLAEAASLSH
jgi:hypothetical protein